MTDTGILKRGKEAILKTSYPFLKWLGNAHLPYTRNQISGDFYYSLKSSLRHGDILLTRTNGEFSNVAIPGAVKHSAIYVGDAVRNQGSPATEFVVEAVGSGVRHVSLLRFMDDKDLIIVRRPRFCQPNVAAEAAVQAISLIGKPYDMMFDLSNQSAFYCSEVALRSYQNAMDSRLLPMPFVPREKWGAPTYTPNDILLADKFWETVIDSRDHIASH